MARGGSTPPKPDGAAPSAPHHLPFVPPEHVLSLGRAASGGFARSLVRRAWNPQRAPLAAALPHRGGRAPNAGLEA
jgi:hypothetical protein